VWRTNRKVRLCPWALGKALNGMSLRLRD